MLVENPLLRSPFMHFVCKRHKTNQKSSSLYDPPLRIITFPLIPPPEWSIFTLPISTLTSVRLADSSLSTWPIFLLLFFFGFSAIKISTLHSDRLIVHLFCRCGAYSFLSTTLIQWTGSLFFCGVKHCYWKWKSPL